MPVNFPVFIIGLIFLLAGILLLVKNRKSDKEDTASVMAEVVDYKVESRISSDDNGVTETTVYYPIVRYYVSGEYYEQKSDVGKGRRKYDVGQRIEIRYNPLDPQKFIITGDNTELIAAVTAILIGVGVTAMSFFAK